MRAFTAVSLLLLSAFGSLACANRGMHAPDDGGGAGVGGTVATAGRGGGGGTAGGPAGTGGLGGSCAIPADAGPATSGACSALFNFETDTEGAMINTTASSAFMTLAKSNAFTYCGSGALAITSQFSGTSGSTIRGDVILPLPGAPVDVTGKTITVHIASDPGCSDLNLSMVLNTQSGPMYFTSAFPISMVTNSWKMASVTVSADGGATNALNLSLQAFSTTGYQGTIYIDEVDVR